MTKEELNSYQKILIAFSGGKDSTACFLHLLDLGVSKEKIELWHQDVDGRGETFMDWEVTPDYCFKFAKAFNVPIYFSWKEGGFKGEMLRNNQPTRKTTFMDENYNLVSVGGEGKDGTRLKFPQISPDLTTRWCSSYLKIDICAAAIRNQDRFNNVKTLVISGERGEESAARSKYNVFEPDRADLRDGKKFTRHVDRWRPIKDWTEQQVWDIIEKHKVRPHPCYSLGYNRCSCKFCIFGNADQFATSFHISPEIGKELVEYEGQFGVTMKRKESLTELISKGVVYSSITEELVALATSYIYTENIFMDEWVLPAGAFKEGSCGPI